MILSRRSFIGWRCFGRYLIRKERHLHCSHWNPSWFIANSIELVFEVSEWDTSCLPKPVSRRYTNGIGTDMIIYWGCFFIRFCSKSCESLFIFIHKYIAYSIISANYMLFIYIWYFCRIASLEITLDKLSYGKQSKLKSFQWIRLMYTWYFH